MAIVIHRTTLQVKTSVSRNEHPLAFWIHDPDLTAVEGVPRKYRKISGDSVLERTPAEKQAVDDAEAADEVVAKEERIRKAVLADPLTGLAAATISISGLTVTVTINSVVVGDQTTVTADPTDTTYLMLCYVLDTATEALAVQGYTKTTGLYAALTADEILVSHIGEWSTPANGTELTEI